MTVEARREVSQLAQGHIARNWWGSAIRLHNLWILFPPHQILRLVPEYTANLELPSSPAGSVAPGFLWFSSAVPLQSQKLPGWPKASRDTSLRTLWWRRYLLGILQYLNPSSRETLATGLVC